MCQGAQGKSREHRLRSPGARAGWLQGVRWAPGLRAGAGRPWRTGGGRRARRLRGESAGRGPVHPAGCTRSTHLCRRPRVSPGPPLPRSPPRLLPPRPFWAVVPARTLCEAAGSPRIGSPTGASLWGVGGLCALPPDLSPPSRGPRDSQGAGLPGTSGGSRGRGARARPGTSPPRGALWARAGACARTLHRVPAALARVALELETFPSSP